MIRRSVPAAKVSWQKGLSDVTVPHACPADSNYRRPRATGYLQLWAPTQFHLWLTITLAGIAVVHLISGTTFIGHRCGCGCADRVEEGQCGGSCEHFGQVPFRAPSPLASPAGRPFPDLSRLMVQGVPELDRALSAVRNAKLELLMKSGSRCESEMPSRVTVTSLI